MNAPAAGGDRGRRDALFLTSGALALGALGLFAGPAAAQETAAVEDVVVTAQFREQNIQDTPLSITAVTAEMLEARSQTSIVDVANQAPNVRLTPGSAAFGPSLQAHIRGVGQHDFNFALEPGVGMYVDDVYYSTLTGSVFDLLDLERVEVLRGPQGTLAGQNSIGGAIKLYSRKPDGEGGGYVQGTYGSYDRTEVRAAAEFTLAPDLFARIAGVSHASDGYVTRYDYGCTHPGSPVKSAIISENCELGTEGGKSYTAIRGALRWTPTTRLEMNLAADFTNDDSEGSPFTLMYVGSTTAAGATPAANTSINGVSLGTAAGSPFISYSLFGSQWADDTFSQSPYITYSTYTNPAPIDGSAPYAIPAIYQVDSWGVSNTIDFAITDKLKLTSITAFRYYEGDWGVDEDSSPIGSTTLYNAVWHRQWTQELRLSGALFADALDFTIGGFYLDQRSHYGARVDLRTLQFIENDDIPATTTAAFANFDWHITDALDVIVGARYTDSEKTFTYGRLGIPGSGPPNNGLAPAAVRGLNGLSSTYSGSYMDYRAAVQYRLTDNVMAYAQFSTGHRGGGINPRPFFVAQALPHNPEQVSAYEIGAKTDFFDRRLRLNASAFFNKYEDILFATTNCPFTGGPATPCFLPINAGEAEVQGYELEAVLRPVDGLSIDASVSTLDFEYTTIAPNAASAGISLASTAPFAPELKYAIGVEYDINVGDRGTLTPRLDWSYQDSYFTTPSNSPFSQIPDYSLLNGRLTWRAADGDWQLALEGTNLTDELYYLGLFDNRGSSQTVQALPAPPRRWAVSVRRNF
ncbi:MAG: TonB-dependent receptor [Hyphomonadaceae bacterium]|nr:TonB-dependent receptor [Hyphomonadaceae bacterium]